MSLLCYITSKLCSNYAVRDHVKNNVHDVSKTFFYVAFLLKMRTMSIYSYSLKYHVLNKRGKDRFTGYNTNETFGDFNDRIKRWLLLSCFSTTTKKVPCSTKSPKEQLEIQFSLFAKKRKKRCPNWKKRAIFLTG